jgi:hypothetical protein
LLKEIIERYKAGIVNHTEVKKEAPIERGQLPVDSTVPSKPVMESASLFKYFDEDPLETSEKIKERIVSIYEMLNGDDAYDELNLRKMLMKIEGRIGSPDFGKSRVDHVYQYLRLGQEMEMLQKQKEKYETQDSDN